MSKKKIKKADTDALCIAISENEMLLEICLTSNDMKF